MHSFLTLPKNASKHFSMRVCCENSTHNAVAPYTEQWQYNSQSEYCLFYKQRHSNHALRTESLFGNTCQTYVIERKKKRLGFLRDFSVEACWAIEAKRVCKTNSIIYNAPADPPVIVGIHLNKLVLKFTFVCLSPIF